MASQIEDLSIELWLEMFSYLKLQHQFKAFSDLNKRLDAILFSYRNYLTYKNNDDDCQYLFTRLLPFLQRREEVTSLRLEKTKKIEKCYNIDLLYFPRLTTLILHRMEITEYVVKILQASSTSLRYLHVSSITSGTKQCMHKLLETIISLPNLQSCRLRLGISMSALPLTVSSTSPVKDLRLIGKNENCSIDRLMTLLSYFPCLQSLHIITSQLIASPVGMIQSPISKFTLDIKEWTISLHELNNFIASIAPQVKEFKLICRSPIENRDYLKSFLRIDFIQTLNYLQNLTLVIHRHSNLDEEFWNKTCETLTKRNNSRGITFHIDQTSRYV